MLPNPALFGPMGIGMGQMTTLLPAVSVAALSRVMRHRAPPVQATAVTAVRPQPQWAVTNTLNSSVAAAVASWRLLLATSAFPPRHGYSSSTGAPGQHTQTKQQQHLSPARPTSSLGPELTDEAHTRPIPLTVTPAVAPPPLLPPRVKGIGRKMLLRQINRTIVRRIARRATIGIPVLGLYFVVRILKRDAANLKAAIAAGDPRLKYIFLLAVGTELTDLAAQLAITIGTGLSTGLLPSHLVGLLGLSTLPALLPLADKVSVACAAVSCTAGLLGEGIKAAKEQDKGDQH